MFFLSPFSIVLAVTSAASKGLINVGHLSAHNMGPEN